MYQERHMRQNPEFEGRVVPTTRIWIFPAFTPADTILSTKSDVSITTHYKDTKGDSK